MALVRIIVDTAKSGGKPIPNGTLINHPEAWRHCLPGFRNSKPIAEPVDEETTKLVAEKLKRREARASVEKKNLQIAIDKLAAKLGLEDGKFKRSKDGKKVLKASEAEQALVDTAAAYGIHPTPPSIDS